MTFRAFSETPATAILFCREVVGPAILVRVGRYGADALEIVGFAPPETPVSLAEYLGLPLSNYPHLCASFSVGQSVRSVANVDPFVTLISAVSLHCCTCWLVVSPRTPSAYVSTPRLPSRCLPILAL